LNNLKYTDRIRKIIGTLLLIFILAIPFSAPIQQYLSIPDKIVTFHDQTPIEVPDLGDNISIDASQKSIQAIDSSNFYAEGPGNSELIYEVAGFPIKRVNVSILEDIQVVPGGQSIGVQLHTQGVLVVGHHLVNAEETAVSPGEDADIQVGDIILDINGNSIEEMKDVKPFVEQAGEENSSLDVKIKRGNQTIETELTPKLDEKDNEYKIGLYIRDAAAGIGTMTFHDPDSHKYGALGHVISDMDTNKPIEIHDGSIVRSSVNSIEKGNNGIPGEKQARFANDSKQLGTITKNSPFGIFGKLEDEIKNGSYDNPMPVALSHEVEEGPAEILTVVEGEKVEAFDIEIVSSVPQKFPATKGMVVQITDPELLKHTGGIVQGMSGSPIIQKGKIVGAVTHVFVNDPTSGYGVHIEWMLNDAGITVKKESQEKAG